MFPFESAKPPRVSPDHLITFYFVAEGKSFKLASDLLFLSPPTVLLHIKALEAGCGVKLIHVRKKRVILTGAGEVLLSYARELYRQLKHAEMCLQNFREEMLRIGVALTLTPTVATAVGAFTELFPHIKVKIREGPTYQIVEEISNLLHDLAVVANLDYGIPELKAMEVSRGHKMIFVASSADPLSLEDKLDLTALNGHPLILPAEKSATRAVLLKILEEQEIEPVIIAEVDNIESAKSLAKMGQGVALLLEDNVIEELRDGKLKALPFKEEIRMGVDVLIHKDNPLRSIGGEFVSLLRQAYRNRSVPKVLPATKKSQAGGKHIGKAYGEAVGSKLQLD
jgi:DNA-binding transcriptional LysR family regulator